MTKTNLTAAELEEFKWPEAVKQQALMAAIWQAPVPGPESWACGFWAKSGPGNPVERGHYAWH